MPLEQTEQGLQPGIVPAEPLEPAGPVEPPGEAGAADAACPDTSAEPAAAPAAADGSAEGLETQPPQEAAAAAAPPLPAPSIAPKPPLPSPAGSGVQPPSATFTQRSPFAAAAQKEPYGSPTQGSPTRGSPTRGSPTRGSPTRLGLPPPPPAVGPGAVFNEVFVGEAEPRRLTSILREEGSGALRGTLGRKVSWADIETGVALHELQEYEPSVAVSDGTDSSEDPWRDNRCCSVM